MILKSQQLTIRALENTENKYPSIFFEAVLTTSMTDSAKSILYPVGCTNLNSKAGTLNIQTDWEHEGFYASKNKEKIRNAGVMTAVRVEEDGIHDQLIGTFRVGKEHTLVDRFGKVYGSSYGSAWLMYASDQVNKNGGSIDDYIPEHIRSEYITDNTIALKAVSVEIDFGAYPVENYEDMNATLHIHKFDILSIGFLTHSPPGQSQSFIKKETVEIRSKSHNQKNVMENTTILRCLCDYSSLYLGQHLLDSVTNEMYQVTAATLSVDESQSLYTLTNLLTSEEQTNTLEVIKENENLDSVWSEQVMEWLLSMVLPLLTGTTRSTDADKLSEHAIRMCQKCQKMSLTKSEVEVKALPVQPAVESPEEEVKESNDMTLILESLKAIEDRLVTLESATLTKSIEEASSDQELPKKDDETVVRSFKAAVEQPKVSAVTLRMIEPTKSTDRVSALNLKL